MSKYAENTSVSSDKSRSDIEKTLRKYGAARFIYGWDEEQVVLGFTMNEQQVRFILPMPDPSAKEYRLTPTGRQRSARDAASAVEQEIRRRWRSLCLVIKAKLEAVETGIVSFEDEFLAHIVLPVGSTAGSWVRPQVDAAYNTGKMPKMIPYFSD